jgi:ribosomal protein L37AE/L43A
MNYTQIYDNLINSRKLLNRTKKDETYYELHHIIPKCMGGANFKDNLVLLTPKEHLLAHLLLERIYKDTKYNKKLLFAIWIMITNNGNHNYKCSIRTYEKTRISISTYLKDHYVGKNNPNYGNCWPQEKRDAFSIKKTGNTTSWNTGKTKDNNESLLSVSKKLSEFRTGKKFGPMSIESNEKRSAKLKGKPQPKSQCNVCGKEGSVSNIARWHNANCYLQIASATQEATEA